MILSAQRITALRTVCVFLTSLLTASAAGTARAQTTDEPICWLLGRPELNLEPTFSVDNLLARPRVQDVATGRISRLTSETTFELILSMGIPTQIPRVELTLETIFAPSEQDNEPEFEAELNLILLSEEQTGGWMEAHFDIIDQVSPRERPGSGRAYDHKLNFELDIAFNPFRRLPSSRWLHHVSAEVSFDYLATGLPRRGDVIDGERFLDDASGWSVSALVSLPLAPLRR